MKKLIYVIVIQALLVVITSEVYASNACKKPAKDECSNYDVGGAFVTIAGKFGGEITKEELLEASELGIDGCARGSKVYSFTLKITSGNTTKTIRGISYIFSKEIRSAFKALQKGDRFEFKQVKAHLPSGDSIDALGRTFTVV